MPANFSVVIPSRNRPAMLRKAIESVLRQEMPPLEVIVINDGSDGEFAEQYRLMGEEYSGRVRFFHLIQTPRGHGQSFVVNLGAMYAEGEFLCFLDDDDFWTDEGHLARAARCLDGAAGKAELFLSNQNAVLNGQRHPGPLWLEDLLKNADRPLVPDAQGAYRVEVRDLLRCRSHAQVNTVIARRSLYLAIGGFDNSIGYENDRDLFLRLIDNAEGILYVDEYIGQHNIPDPGARQNMSTAVDGLEKRLFQLRVFDKAILFARHPLIRQYGREQKGFTLKHMARTLADQGKTNQASYYAREALLTSFNLRWLGYTLYLAASGLFGRAA